MSEIESRFEIQRTKRHWYAYGLLLLVLAAACTALAVVYVSFMAPRFVGNWPNVIIGMSKDEVVGLLGEPTGKCGPTTVNCDGDSPPSIAAAAGVGAWIFGGLDEYWTWESVPSSSEQLSDEDRAKYVFSRLFGPSEESFVVYFDLQGKVSKCRPPDAGPYASLYEEQANTE